MSQKGSGIKIYRSSPLANYSDLHRKKTMKAKEEEGDFKHSHDIKPYNSADYSAMENDWPNPDDPPYPPWPPWNPPKPNPQDPVTPGGDEDVIQPNCRSLLCWCPDKWVDANVVCRGQIVKVVVAAFDRDRAQVRWSGTSVGIKAREEEGFSGPPIEIVVTVRVAQYVDGQVVAINNIEQSLSIENCDECCQCENSQIGYLTLSMWNGDTQNLGITGADEAGCEYTWTLTGSAVGTITPSEDGLECLYEAPASNSDCAGPVTITLYCDEVEADSITIVIRNLGDTANDPGSPTLWNYMVCIKWYDECPPDWCQQHEDYPDLFYCQRCYYGGVYWWCNGEFIAGTECGQGTSASDGRVGESGSCEGCFAKLASCATLAGFTTYTNTYTGVTGTASLGGTSDLRNQTVIDKGCCGSTC